MDVEDDEIAVETVQQAHAKLPQGSLAQNIALTEVIHLALCGCFDPHLDSCASCMKEFLAKAFADAGYADHPYLAGASEFIDWRYSA
jgi:hypothetical protein